MVSLSAPECRENYEEMITEQKRVYSQCWETILEEHFHFVSMNLFLNGFNTSNKNINRLPKIFI